MSDAEGPPIITPPSEVGSSGSGEKSEKKKSKKHLGEFGAIAVESQPERPKRSSLMDYLTKSKEKPEKPVEKEGLFSIPKQREDELKDKKDEETESFWQIKKESADAEESEGHIPEDVEEASEQDAPTEEVSPEESRDIQKVFADEAPSEVEKLSSDAPEEEKVAAEAVDRLHEKMVVDDADLETAYQEVRSELGLPNEAAEETPAELDAEVEPEESEIPAESAEMPPVLMEEAGETEQPETPEAPPEDAEEDENRPAAPAAGSGGHSPPPGPVPQRMPGFGPMPIPAQRNAPPFNAAPAPPTKPNTYTPQYHETSPAAMALFGGIIGYLIGRRRGRIRAEKKLLPVQKKLREQVEDLEWQLREREDRLRRAAAEAVRDGSVIGGGLFATGRYNTLREQRRGKNAEQLHAAPKAPEHIGRMMMSANAIERAAPQSQFNRDPNEKAPETVQHIERQSEALHGKRVETMSRAELLSMSETIMVEGSSLRQIFETHLISEKGLRRLIAEHLRGGDVTRQLRQEIVEHEIDFERDPGLRDMKVQANNPSHGGAVQGQTALEKMFEQAAATMPINNDSTMLAQTEALAQAEEAKKSKTKQRVMDISLVGIITALVTTAIVVYITHH